MIKEDFIHIVHSHWTSLYCTDCLHPLYSWVHGVLGTDCLWSHFQHHHFTCWPQTTLSMAQQTSGGRCYNQDVFSMPPKGAGFVYTSVLPFMQWVQQSPPTVEPCHILVRSESSAVSDWSEGLVSNKAPSFRACFSLVFILSAGLEAAVQM